MPIYNPATSTPAVAQNAEARMTSDFSTTSTTYVNVTGLSVTFTTNKTNGAVLVNAAMSVYVSGAIFLYMRIYDGTTAKLQPGVYNATAVVSLSATAIYSSVTAQSNTYAVQIKVASGTANVMGTDDNGHSCISAVEL